MYVCIFMYVCIMSTLMGEDPSGLYVCMYVLYVKEITFYVCMYMYVCIYAQLFYY